VTVFIAPSSALGQLSGSLTFHILTYDKKAYDENPKNYEVEFYGPNRQRFVERKPSLILDEKEILSMTIEKRSTYVFGEKRQATKADSPTGYNYIALVLLTDRGARLFNEFANSHAQQFAEWRFGNIKIGHSQIIGKFGENDKSFNMGLEETSKERLEKIFAPLKGRLAWKE
ncbi:MAG TPA: hypothetical protein VKH64_02185, partial [Candidatus Binatia bacterium]|nr:hypothetical protein [Candidatus Binatia bacterium]